MRPEDIQTRNFLVGLRGYDKDEVRTFLAEVASEHAALLADLEDARNVAMNQMPAPAVETASDDFEDLGASVAAVLRAAKESAREVLGDAETRRTQTIEAAEEALRKAKEDAEEIRSAAHTTVADAQAEADQIRSAAQAAVAQAQSDADQIRANADAILADARAEAERIVREASDRARQIEIEGEARRNNAFEDAARRESTMRARLVEASDEIHLALVALGEALQEAETVDLREDQQEEAPALG